MKKKAFITGITGQDGSYLSEFLLEKDYEVYGLVRRLSKPNTNNINHILNDIELIDGDMCDQSSLYKAIKSVKPDEVYNLAAQSFVATSWKQPELTINVNAQGNVRVLEALRLFAPSAKFYQASTSELFGKNHNQKKLTEKTRFEPCSPYGYSKLLAYWATVNYRDSYNMFAVNGILFNHESPRRGIEFVTRKISDGVAKIKLNIEDKIKLGNLDAYRDWGYSKDYVEAMWLMLQNEKPENYVISMGKAHSIKDFLEHAFNYVGIKDWEKYVETDPRFLRPVDIKKLCGDSRKAKKELNWKPKTSFKQLVEMMVQNDLDLLKNGK